MADLTITAANVVASAGSRTAQGIAGETITAGQAVYASATTGQLLRADSNSATAEARVPVGIALNGASASQPLGYLISGSITIGATMTAGVAYYLSDAPGGICPVADLGSGEYPCIIGIASSASVLKVGIASAGVAL